MTPPLPSPTRRIYFLKGRNSGLPLFSGVAQAVIGDEIATDCCSIATATATQTDESY